MIRKTIRDLAGFTVRSFYPSLFPLPCMSRHPFRSFQKLGAWIWFILLLFCRRSFSLMVHLFLHPSNRGRPKQHPRFSTRAVLTSGPPTLMSPPPSTTTSSTVPVPAPPLFLTISSSARPSPGYRWVIAESVFVVNQELNDDDRNFLCPDFGAKTQRLLRIPGNTDSIQFFSSSYITPSSSSTSSWTTFRSLSQANTHSIPL